MYLEFIPEKNAIVSKTNLAALIKLSAPQHQKQVKKPHLNIAFVIDVSGSMGDVVEYNQLPAPITPDPIPQWPALIQPQQPPYLPPISWPKRASYSHKTKLDKVKEAMKMAIKELKEEDIFSIVTFDTTVNVLFSSQKATPHHKNQAIDKINQLNPGSSTALHGGWLEGARQVANNLQPEKLNRVILLTDGEANHGETNLDVIASDVANLLKNKISTTTFGVGERFNEELLTQMAEVGQGNFYYIEKGEINNYFIEEFSGLSNTYAQNIKLSLDLAPDVEVEQLNDFKVMDKSWLIPNLIFNKKVNIIFNFKYTGKKKTKKIKLADLKLTYLPANAKKEIVLSHQISLDLVDQKSWDKLEVNQEAANLKALLEIARIKQQSREYFKRGDIIGGQTYLRTSAVNYAGFHDAAVIAASATLNDLALQADQQSVSTLNKTLMSQSYNTRNSK